MRYRTAQAQKALNLMAKGEIFNNDPGNGTYAGRQHPFALQDGENNIYAPIRESVKNYFSENRISWWGGKAVTTHPLSSQVACLNHLFPIRSDKDAVLSIARTVDPAIIDVLPVEIDVPEYGYIAFEVTSSKDLLNEKFLFRGSNCTSIDALILGKRKDGVSTLLGIEWKYTEYYANTDKGDGKAGRVRKDRYEQLIDDSQQLKRPKKPDIFYEHIYYYEPFYQLMRQTLWLEQVVKHKDTEIIKADDFIHLHIIPPENTNLLNKTYFGGKAMEETWLACLEDKNKYKIISPKDLLSPLGGTKYTPLLKYLKTRYWE